MKLRPGQAAKHPTLGAVEILEVDDDPRALVWVCEVENRDRDHLVNRDTLSELQEAG